MPSSEKSLTKVNYKGLYLGLIGVLAFLVLWTVRSYFGYALFGWGSIDGQISQAHSWYLEITKFLWLPLALFLIMKIFKQDWKNDSPLCVAPVGIKPQGRALNPYKCTDPAVELQGIATNKSGLFRLGLDKIWGYLIALIPVLYVLFYLNFSFTYSLNKLTLLFSVVYEEVLFRGFLLPFFEKYLKFWQANILQAAFFVLVHYSWWVFDSNYGIDLQSSIYIFFLGLIWGCSTKITRSVYPAILAHFLHNFVLS